MDGSTRCASWLTLCRPLLNRQASSVWDGVFTDEQAKRGEAAYRQECSNCHGAELEGGDMTPPLVGGGFTSNWNDLTLGDLFERIRLTMPLDNLASCRASRTSTSSRSC